MTYVVAAQLEWPSLACNRTSSRLSSTMLADIKVGWLASTIVQSIRPRCAMHSNAGRITCKKFASVRVLQAEAIKAR